MVDPLAEVVSLLQPMARFSKQVEGAAGWQVRRTDAGEPFYCVVLAGACRIQPDGEASRVLEAGDFVLIPAAYGVAMSSVEPPPADTPASMPVAIGDGRFRIGAAAGEPDVRILAGHCSFGAPDAALLVSLLPQIVHVRGERRLALLADLVGEESRGRRAARDVVLARLLEVLLIEALRSAADTSASSGLVRGLADARLAGALRAMHAEPARAWTVPALAREAALSRSTFFERFSRVLGLTPMDYLLAWRMALAKDLLRRGAARITEIAERVGYSSGSTFSVAFTRHVGQPPSLYARQHGRDPLAGAAAPR